MYVSFVYMGCSLLKGFTQGMDPSSAIPRVLSPRKPKDRVAELSYAECDGRRSAILVILVNLPS